MKILISSGATREPVDGVRFISNMSSGATGAALADSFCEAGHAVFYLHGEGAKLPQAKMWHAQFSSFADLNEQFKKLLGRGKFDALVHLAAVSDYSVDAVIADGKERKPGTAFKLPSQAKIELRLKTNFKILDRLATYAGKRKVFITGFKLTCEKAAAKREKAAKELSLRPGVDLAVHNDLQEMRAGKRIFTLYRRGEKTVRCNGTAALAKNLLAEMTKKGKQCY